MGLYFPGFEKPTACSKCPAVDINYHFCQGLPIPRRIDRALPTWCPCVYVEDEPGKGKAEE